MSNPENCALDAHRNLKDAANIPSDKNPIGSTSAPAECEPESKDDLSTIAVIKPGLKGKAPATHVGGKHVIKPSHNLHEQSSKAVHSFFKKTFTDKAAADEGLNGKVPEPEAEAHEENEPKPSNATGDTESTANDKTEPEDANQSKYEQMKADAEHDHQPKHKHNLRGQDE
ncbi:hypothetical protein Hypma_002042 [Hypsizygus marmoreus]|uniref:Uncharacterized protein n=1 Tax=Hypsizygus marmoreus TaxID=39966 RepID=A0A369JDV8_HYPMA|nr:hypothetical protein Hypma_002042 [Hypsizygus marmoreus]